MNSIQGKTAIITGAAGGMGKAFAQALYEKGVRLFLTDIKKKRGNSPSFMWEMKA